MNAPLIKAKNAYKSPLQTHKKAFCILNSIVILPYLLIILQVYFMKGETVKNFLILKLFVD